MTGDHTVARGLDHRVGCEHPTVEPATRRGVASVAGHHPSMNGSRTRRSGSSVCRVGEVRRAGPDPSRRVLPLISPTVYDGTA